MRELEFAFENLPIWKTLLWCYYPISVLIIIELISRYLNDDDNQDGGRMIPVYKNV